MSAFTITSTFEGNLTSDITLRETGSGKAVGNARVAVTQRVRVGANEFVDRNEFINVVLWGDMAVNAAACLHKGNRVIVSGDLKQRSYTGKDGNERYVTEVHANMFGASVRWHVVAGIEKAKEALASFDEAGLPEPAEDPVYDG